VHQNLKTTALMEATHLAYFFQAKKKKKGTTGNLEMLRHLANVPLNPHP